MKTNARVKRANKRGKTMKNNIRLIKKLLNFNPAQLEMYLKSAIPTLRKGYTQKHKNNDYLYYENRGSNVLLVAHLDTVHRTFKTNTFNVITKDNKTHITNISGDCLGADDRAGVFTILEYLRLYNEVPNILFTQGEETGGTGIASFVSDGHDTKHIMLAIEIDKSGLPNVACVYDDLDSELESFLLSHDMDLVSGSYTDICNLQDIGISSVNISANYYHQHTKNEYMIVDDVYQTILLLNNMVQSLKTPQSFKVKLYQYTKVKYYEPLKTKGHIAKCEVCETKHNLIITNGGITICHDCIDELYLDYMYGRTSNTTYTTYDKSDELPCEYCYSVKSTTTINGVRICEDCSLYC
jgi:hypothetical protein